jgi:hypothetical protein
MGFCMAVRGVVRRISARPRREIRSAPHFPGCFGTCKGIPFRDMTRRKRAGTLPNRAGTAGARERAGQFCGNARDWLGTFPIPRGRRVRDLRAARDPGAGPDGAREPREDAPERAGTRGKRETQALARGNRAGVTPERAGP